VRLSLDQVRESGLPAYFFDHGEQLLFLDGELFELRERESSLKKGSRPKPLPHRILEDGVGIEYGWRHAADCGCPMCWHRERHGSGQEAVA